MLSHLRHVLVIVCFLLLTGCTESNGGNSESHTHTHSHNHNIEYGVFYFETQGDFMVPVEADAPAIYSWNSKDSNIKGNVEHLWKELNLQGEVEYSFDALEIVLLNHFGNQGWELHTLEVAPVHAGVDSIRTAYRYVFVKRS